MTTAPRSTADDVAAALSLLGPANPVPDPALAREDVLSARASVGLARASASTPTRAPRGRFVAAGAVAVLSVMALVALAAMPATQDDGTISLATGPGGPAVASAYAATARSGTARGLLTVTSGSDSVTATGIGDFDGGAAQAEIVLVEGSRSPAATITVIRTGEAVYAKLPPGTSPLAADKPWVSLDARTLTQVMQLALGDVGAQVSGAPLDALAYLKAVSGDVQVVGPDTTRGEATTRYRGTVDPQKVAEQLPAGVRPDATRAAGKVGPLPADLWIDGQGRLRKLVLTADLSQVEDGAVAPAGPATVTVELWDFGTAVDVTAPPPDQVVDVGGILGTFLGGARRP